MAELPLLKILIITGLTLGLFAVGLGIRWRDFITLITFPRAALNGLLMQWLLLPALALIIVLIHPLPAVWVLGIAILAASPGGPLSNLATYLGNGNGALSITLTAVSTLLAPLTLPLLVALLLTAGGLTTENLNLPFGKIVERLILTLLLPVVAGMAVRHWLPRVASALQSPFKWLAVALFIVMFIHANWTYWDRFAEGIPRLLPIALLLMAGIGLLVETLGRFQSLPGPDRMTLGLEVGIQNITTGLFLGEVVLARPEVTIFNLIYGAMIPVFAFTMILIYRRIKPSVGGNN